MPESRGSYRHTEADSVFTLSIAAWSALTDLVLAVFPATIFRNLQMKRSRKIGLSIIMGLGFLSDLFPLFLISTVTDQVEDKGDDMRNYQNHTATP